MKKLRILCCSEASFLSTGYSTYAKQLLTALWNTGKYEIAELARYGEIGDNRVNVPWIVYPNMPNKQNEQEVAIYHSDLRNEFGMWRFEEVIIDFKPDYVISFSDPWMDDFIGSSPLRDSYEWLWMATVDSMPQDDAWFDHYMNADGVFFYSDWGKYVVEKQGGDKIKTLEEAPPSVDNNIFYPTQNKKQHKVNLGLDANSFIIGTVMRNQKRKLFPDLMESFADYLEKCRGTDLYNRSYLYLHTTYPDLGWDIPELIREHKIGHKTIATYKCTSCKFVAPLLYRGARTFCPKCNNYSLGFPTVQYGVEREDLAKIYNLFDVFVQYAVCEGFGIPSLEAAYCGVPIMSVDYSAMSDVVRKLKGIPINVQRLFRDAETNSYRALPDNKHLSEELYKFANLSEAYQNRKKLDTYKAAITNYTWKKTTDRWMARIDNPIKKYKSITSLPSPNLKDVPLNANHNQLLDYIYAQILYKKDKIGDFNYLRMLKWLNYGARTQCRGGLVLPDDSVIGARLNWELYNMNDCLNDSIKERQKIDFWTDKYLYDNGQRPEFIHFAHNRIVKDGQSVSVNSQ